jgi:hypothetical protein
LTTPHTSFHKQKKKKEEDCKLSVIFNCVDELKNSLLNLREKGKKKENTGLNKTNR